MISMAEKANQNPRESLTFPQPLGKPEAPNPAFGILPNSYLVVRKGATEKEKLRSGPSTDP